MTCPSGGMADALDLKSGILLDIRVRLPSRVSVGYYPRLGSCHRYVRGLTPTVGILPPLTRFIWYYFRFPWVTPTAGVRRHLLCPLFATRFVSAFFFRARGGAAARRDGGLKEGGAVYAVSARGPVAAVVFLETFLQDASGSRRTAVASGLRGGWRRRMSTLV